MASTLSASRRRWASGLAPSTFSAPGVSMARRVPSLGGPVTISVGCVASLKESVKRTLGRRRIGSNRGSLEERRADSSTCSMGCQRRAPSVDMPSALVLASSVRIPREMLRAVASTDDVTSDPVLRRIRIPLIRRAILTRADGRAEDLFVIDLGLSGVFVERPEALPTGERVGIRFTLPGNDIPVQAACRVAWWHPPGAPLVSKSLPSGVGLEFVEVSR